MEAPKIKVGEKQYTARPPKTKLWRELVKYRRDFGNPEKIANDPNADVEALDVLLGIICQLLPSEITPELLEEETELVDFVQFVAKVQIWIELIIEGKAKDIPGKNVGKAGK